MGFFDFLSGEFIDVIEWTDDSRDTMVWRFQTRGNAIKYGAKLTVREGQAAVFVHEGQIGDVFGPGLWMLETNNLPVMTRLQHWDHGFRSPFKSEVYFVNTTRFNDQKWGTRNPIMARDPEFGPVRLRAFGTYSMRVTDPALFMTEIVGTDGEFTTDEISLQLRNIIVQEASRALAASQIPVLDMAANTGDLGSLIATAISPTIERYGLTIPEFYVENISLPDEVEKMLDKRTSMGIVGDLGRFSQFAMADSMMRSADQPAGGMAAGLGAGLGAAMGGMMAQQQQGPWGAMPAPQPAVATPPPLTPPVQWHIAIDGAASGPFNQAELSALVKEGKLTRDSLAWSQGQDGWKAVSEIPALSGLFASQPPPLPGTPPPLG